MLNEPGMKAGDYLFISSSGIKRRDAELPAATSAPPATSS